jgi:hypothetical protein
VSETAARAIVVAAGGVGRQCVSAGGALGTREGLESAIPNASDKPSRPDRVWNRVPTGCASASSTSGAECLLCASLDVIAGGNHDRAHFC